MKKKYSTIVLIAMLIISGCAVTYIENAEDVTVDQHKVVTTTTEAKIPIP